ncbi:MAG TPA: metal ABC transporter substrate-binding protein, partial [Bacilli bacterium]|nr:metal ABC transporter substrate-binding protein [Bacilli bacterium]
MKKKLLLLLPFLLLAGCKAREKPDIVVTSFVSYDAVTNIVGDKLKVKNIVPWGSELHDFEPTPRDIEDINNAKLFVYTHPALETWVKDLVTNKNSFDMSIHSDVEYACKVKKQEHHDHEHDHDHTLHYWTDPHIYIRVMNDLLTVLIDISPANETYFTENHNNYTARLLATSNDFRDFL